MALTFIDYTAPATYSFTFDYLDISNVKAYVNGVQKTQGVHYTVQTSPKAVVFTAGNAPAAGANVRIKRETNRITPLVDFNNGSTLLASDLDTALTQTLYINQEVSELNDTTLAIEAGSSNYTALDSRIVDLSAPVNAKDATNKTYVDTADALKLAKAGDSMSGALSMGSNKITNLGNPTVNTDATNKTYVDTADALKLSKAGDSMSGILSMGSNKIISLASPTVNTDAANKTYVDTTISNIGSFGSSEAPQRWAFTATAGQVDFVITGATASDARNYLVYANGIAKDPTVDFTFNVSTTTITFTAAPGSGVKVLVLAIGYRIPTELQLAPGQTVSSLTVSGATQTGTLNVTGTSQLTGNATLNGTLSVSGVSQLTGNVNLNGTFSTPIISATSSAFGYKSGSWSTVTQLGSRTSAVTINKPSGWIILFATANSTSYTTFTVNNTTVASSDMVVVSQVTGYNKHATFVTAVAANSFDITFASLAGTTIDAPIFNFMVLKGAGA
jgi:hypothetical protein